LTKAFAGATVRAPTRVVHCADALRWLSDRPVLAGCSVVTSLPDASELPGVSFAAWRGWFADAAALVLSRTPPDGAALFYQTDVKRAGAWVDKAYLVQRAAEEAGLALLFHKIACRLPPGPPASGRAAYAHLLCFSRGLRADLGRATADVLPDAGAMTWVRAIGLAACREACRWILENTATRTVVDPFCGVGTVLAVANELGMDAVGVELNKKRARKARRLALD
jgi:DNA methylase